MKNYNKQYRVIVELQDGSTLEFLRVNVTPATTFEMVENTVCNTIQMNIVNILRMELVR